MSGWEVRTVDMDGGNPTVLRVSDTDTSPGVNIVSIERRMLADERLTLTVPALHPNSAELELFSREVQVWRTHVPEALTLADEPLTLDGEPLTLDVGSEVRGWFRPARWSGDRAERRVECDGIFGHLLDEVVGGPRPNHIVSPHLDPAGVGSPPSAWSITGNVEDAAIVDNNRELWDHPKAVQLNQADVGQDGYAWQRITVPAALAGVPWAAAATVFIADGIGGAPAWGGPAYERRGLMIHRLDSSGTPVSEPQVAQITDETPRNEVVRLQTPEVLPQAGETIEVRLYAPAAWSVWRWAALLDGRRVHADRVDKSEAVELLVAHAQDASIGKQDRNITVDAQALGEQISREWPWWRREIVGEAITDLADTFEIEMHYTPTTRALRVRRQSGTDRSGDVTLTKVDFTDWSATVDRSSSATRVVMQGEGSGVAVDEWIVDTPSALGQQRARLEFAPPGTPLVSLRDSATELHERTSRVTVLPTATIAGALALEVRPGDTLAVDLDHGSIVYDGLARVTAVALDPVALTAALTLEPVQ